MLSKLDQINKMKELVVDINYILSKYGIKESIELSDLTITNKTVSDLAKKDAKLSNIITNYVWPSISSATVYHYTSRDAAESILNTNRFRLTNIAKRFHEGEIDTFCKTHNIKGYLEKDEFGEPVYKNLIMPNTFYASFTGTSLTEAQEEYFWNLFANCDGVRLKIKITANNSNFRKIFYELKSKQPIDILNDIETCVREKYGLEFVLKGISRMCSFYLSGKDYGRENEYRVLHRVWEKSDHQPIGSGENSYLEIPLDVMSKYGYKFEIIEVHAMNKLNISQKYIFSQRKPK